MDAHGSGRSSVMDSLRGCTMGGMRVDKEELKRKITMPEYLRRAIRDAIESKDAAGNRHFDSAAEPSECPVVVFINPNSGGRHGPKLKSRLQELMGEEQVLQSLPHSFSLATFFLFLVSGPAYTDLG